MYRADQIDALLAAFAEEVLKSQWISVSERLPEFEENVLAVFINDFDGSSYVAVGSYNYFDEADGWLWSQGNGCGDLADFETECDDDYKVTHWQPIAAPPAEEPSRKVGAEEASNG